MGIQPNHMGDRFLWLVLESRDLCKFSHWGCGSHLWIELYSRSRWILWAWIGWEWTYSCSFLMGDQFAFSGCQSDFGTWPDLLYKSSYSHWETQSPILSSPFDAELQRDLWLLNPSFLHFWTLGGNAPVLFPNFYRWYYSHNTSPIDIPRD